MCTWPFLTPGSGARDHPDAGHGLAVGLLLHPHREELRDEWRVDLHGGLGEVRQVRTRGFFQNSNPKCMSCSCAAYWTAHRAFHHTSDLKPPHVVHGRRFSHFGPGSLDPPSPCPARLSDDAAPRRAGWCRARARSRPSARAWPTPSSSATPSPRSSAPWVRDTNIS